MFDDLKQDNNQATPDQAAQPASDTAQTPQASAISKPKNIDDMFGDVDPVASQQAPASEANKPSAVQSGKIKPVSQTTTPVAPAAPTPVPAPQEVSAPNIPPSDSMAVTDDRSSGVMRKIIIAVLVIVLLAVVGGGVYYFFLRTDGASEVVDENQNTNTEPVVNENIEDNTNIVDDNDGPVINEDDLDDDFDGLSNGLEKIYGTNPLEADSDNDGVFDQDEVEVYNTDPLVDDSDGDGLSDHEEIIIYATDPNDPDTDGDNFSDGVEVGNGYNPLGNGKLEEGTGGDNLNTNDNL